MTAMVRLVDVNRTYSGVHGSVVALGKLSTTFDGGQFIVIKGPSGCGKSTLLNLVGLLDLPSDGELFVAEERVNGRSATRLAELRRSHIAFLFQDAGIIDRMTVLDNVMMPLLYRRMRREEAKDRALQMIESVGLEHLTGARSETLSGGERQRVGIARILALQPSIIVCDEPTASLDESNSQVVVNYLKSAAASGACVVCASHDPIVFGQADRRIDMSRGQIVSDNRFES